VGKFGNDQQSDLRDYPVKENNNKHTSVKHKPTGQAA